MKFGIAVLLLGAQAAGAPLLHEGHDQHAAGEVTARASELAAAHEAHPARLPQALLFEFEDPRRRAVDFFPMAARQDGRPADAFDLLAATGEAASRDREQSSVQDRMPSRPPAKASHRTAAKPTLLVNRRFRARRIPERYAPRRSLHS